MINRFWQYAIDLGCKLYTELYEMARKENKSTDEIVIEILTEYVNKRRESK